MRRTLNRKLPEVLSAGASQTLMDDTDVRLVEAVAKWGQDFSWKSRALNVLGRKNAAVKLWFVLTPPEVALTEAKRLLAMDQHQRAEVDAKPSTKRTKLNVRKLEPPQALPGFSTIEDVVTAFKTDLPRVQQALKGATLNQRIAWAMRACTKVAFNDLSFNSSLVSSILAEVFEDQLRAGVSDTCPARKLPITLDILPSLGDTFPIVDRQEAARLTLAAAAATRKRQDVRLCADERKRKAAFIAYLTVPGGGKTTAALNLLQLGLEDPQSIPCDVSPDLIQEIEVCCEHNMQYRYGFSLGNGDFSVDEEHEMQASSSLALRLLYCLTGGSHQVGVADAPQQRSFRVFVADIAAAPYAELLLKYVTVVDVLNMTREVWTRKNDPRKDGLLCLLFDDADAVFEATKEEQGKAGSGAKHFQGMLTAWRSAQELQDMPPMLLMVAGTKMDMTIIGQMPNGSFQGLPHIIPLEPLTTDGCVDVMKDVLKRLDGICSTASELFMETLSHYCGGCPRILECLLAAATRLMSDIGPTDTRARAPARSNVNAKNLKKVLEQRTVFTPEQFKQMCDMATRMLESESASLAEYLDPTKPEKFVLVKEILLKQHLNEIVSSDQLVNKKTCGNLKWGDVQSMGLTALVPHDPKHTTRRTDTAPCRPHMPYMLHVTWMQRGQGVLYPDPVLGCSHHDSAPI